MASESDPAVLRIGELARRVAVNQDLLRAWERRYGLLKPMRSPGGYRLYSDADEQRVRRMQAHLARGLAAAEAARAALDEETDQSVAAPPVAPAAAGNPTRAHAFARPDAPFPGTDQGLTGLAGELRDALTSSTGPRRRRCWTGCSPTSPWRPPFARSSCPTWATSALAGPPAPSGWPPSTSRATCSAPGWPASPAAGGQGHGPCAVLACPPGERHDLPLLAFGVVLHRNGWRIIYLGADTPLADLVHTVTEKRPDVVILAAATPERFQESLPDLITLARTAPLRLAGAGATTSIADTVGATILTGDPITAAQRLTPLH